MNSRFSFIQWQLGFKITANPVRVTRASKISTQHRNEHVNKRFVKRVSVQANLCALFQRSEVEDDFPLIGVVDVLVADLVRHHSALDLGSSFSDQVEPNSHQRVHVRRLRKRSRTTGLVLGLVRWWARRSQLVDFT